LLSFTAMILLLNWRKKEKHRNMQKEEALYDFNE
jgi:hypothetical protein